MDLRRCRRGIECCESIPRVRREGVANKCKAVDFPKCESIAMAGIRDPTRPSGKSSDMRDGRGAIELLDAVVWFESVYTRLEP